MISSHTCSQCENEVDAKEYLTAHRKKVHGGVKEFHYNFCNCETNIKDSFNLHQNTVLSRNENFASEICTSKLPPRLSLKSITNGNTFRQKT